ncbi:hypothetical protein JZ751_021626, partial [Albula glossodonta]
MTTEQAASDTGKVQFRDVAVRKLKFLEGQNEEVLKTHSSDRVASKQLAHDEAMFPLPVKSEEILSAITEQQPGRVLATIGRAIPTMEDFKSLCPPKKEHSWLTDEVIVVNTRVMQVAEERLFKYTT